MDDRIWITTHPETCGSLARAWQQGIAQQNLGENASKADFNAFRHQQHTTAFQNAINQAGIIPGTIKQSWARSLIPTAEPADPPQRRPTDWLRLHRSSSGQPCFHTAHSKKLLLPKQLAWRLQQLRATAEVPQPRVSTQSDYSWPKSTAVLL